MPSKNETSRPASPCLADDCQIELPGATLHGKQGVRKTLDWLYRELGSIRFEPVVILVEGDTFFEQFIIKARKAAGAGMQVKATEALVYRDYKVAKLRPYFDRLAVARSRARIAETVDRQEDRPHVLAGLDFRTSATLHREQLSRFFKIPLNHFLMTL